MSEQIAEPTQAVATPAVTDASLSLTGGTNPTSTEKIVESAPQVQSAPKAEYEFDKRLYTEDGKFNKDGAKEFLSEQKKQQEMYEKRILDLRRKVSDGKAIEDKAKVFQDFAPADPKFMKFFDKDTPAETKEQIGKITEILSEKYFDAALTPRQADDVTNALLGVMEEVGVLDTRTKEEKYIARMEWIEKQKQTLGPNADNIIRTTRHFVENTHLFDAKTKNTFLELMESVGSPVISALHQIADGQTPGTIPVNVGNLGGLKSDADLWQEYMNPATTAFRRDQITRERALHGRTSKLSDIVNQ